MWSRQRLLILLCVPILFGLFYYTSTDSNTLARLRTPATPIVEAKTVQPSKSEVTEEEPYQPPPPTYVPPPADRLLKQAADRPIEQGTDIEVDGDAVAFISRPDIRALKWKVAVYDEKRVAPGYWFITPIERIQNTKPGGSWIGPQIYDGNGDLVWSGSHLSNNSWVADFRKLNVEGTDVLAWHNQHTSSALILDNHYSVVKEIPTGDLGPSNTHDFFTVDGGRHYLYIANNHTQWSETRSMEEVGYEGRCNTSYSLIIESDVSTNQKLFTWSSQDHIPWTESTLEIETIRRQCKHEWEYLHANSIEKFENGDYLLSSRLTNTLYRISKDDGSILWRLNGQAQSNGKGDFELINLNFSRQHDARVREQSETYALISLLDNSVGNDEQNATSDWSRAIKIALHFDTKPMRAELVSSIDHPHRELSFRRGNYMILPNGNELVGWSERALQTEYTSQGEMVLEAYLMTEKIGTYRSFKYTWIGAPDYPPDVQFAEIIGDDTSTLAVYASWNGATEVAEWILYETDWQNRKQTELTRAARSGFETEMQYEYSPQYIYVQAVDRHGALLPFGRSETLDTKKVASLQSPG